MVRRLSTKTRAAVEVPGAREACPGLPATNPGARPPNNAVAEHATPAFEACFKNRRLEEENLFMRPFLASASDRKRCVVLGARRMRKSTAEEPRLSFLKLYRPSLQKTSEPKLTPARREAPSNTARTRPGDRTVSFWRGARLWICRKSHRLCWHRPDRGFHDSTH